MKRVSVLDVTPVNESEVKEFFHCDLDKVRVEDVINSLSESGFSESKNDPRLATVYEYLRNRPSGLVSVDELTELKKNHLLVQKALHADLAIPNFSNFSELVTQIFHQVESLTDGSLPNYIPQLAQVSPALWGLSVCTVDGQRFSLGDANEMFSIQSVCKPINYAIAIDAIGVDAVHANVGMEPSGRNFNERVLLPSGIPHNPLINTGAIMTTSLLFPGVPRWQRFEQVTEIYSKLGTRANVQAMTSTYLAEREAGNRNYCLAHMMAEENSGGFPKTANSIESLLDDYFSFCSLGVTTEEMALVAATLANGGLNPISEEQAVSPEAATCTLSVMMTCGMYDASGEFSATSGFPAKSGVSGVIIAVIPGVGGICTYSPLIDSLGNSVRGLEFFKRLSALPVQTSFGNQFNWRVSGAEAVITKLTLREYASLWWAAWNGDEQRIRQLAARGINVNETNYSNRNALNFAISGGHIACVKLLIALGTQMSDVESYLNDAKGQPDLLEIILKNANFALDEKKYLVPRLPSDVGDVESHFAPPNIPVHRFFTLRNGLTLGKAIAMCGLDPDAPFYDLHIRALCGKLIIPNWPMFADRLDLIVRETRTCLALVSVDGQKYFSNNTHPVFSIGNIVRVVLYELAIKEFGFEQVHSFVGKEPSGQAEDSLRLNDDNLPYNPLTLSGCLTICGLLLTVSSIQEIHQQIRVRLNYHADEQFGSGQPTSERVKCLLHLLGSIRPEIVQHGPQILDLYESSHQISVDLSTVAQFAKSLATGTRKESMLSRNGVILSILFSCGMDELSGEWSFKFGVPAKSNGQGVVMVIVPGIMGYAVANCERNTLAQFQTSFDNTFNMHMFKRHFSASFFDPTLYSGTSWFLRITQFLNSAFVGDLSTMKSLAAQGVNVNATDQDGRTALHVAQSVGNTDICAWLIKSGANPEIEDPLKQA